MTAWCSLLKKEWRLNRSFITTELAIATVTGLFAVWLAYRVQLGTVLLFAFVVLHAGYLAAYMIVSLTRDWHLTAHLWLHTPRSGRGLLSAKIASGLISMVLSLGLLSLLGLWTAAVDIELLDEPWLVIVQHGAVAVVEIAALALYLGVWTTALWVNVATTHTRPRKLGGLLGIGLVLALSAAVVALRGTPLYDPLRWGAVWLPLPPTQYDFPGWAALQPLYLGECLFYLLVVAGLFWFAGWFLDHRAEV